MHGGGRRLADQDEQLAERIARLVARELARKRHAPARHPVCEECGRRHHPEEDCDE